MKKVITAFVALIIPLVAVAAAFLPASQKSSDFGSLC